MISALAGFEEFICKNRYFWFFLNFKNHVFYYVSMFLLCLIVLVSIFFFFLPNQNNPTVV